MKSYPIPDHLKVLRSVKVEILQKGKVQIIIFVLGRSLQGSQSQVLY